MLAIVSFSSSSWCVGCFTLSCLVCSDFFRRTKKSMEQVTFPSFFYPKIGDSGCWSKVPKEAKRNPWFVLEKIHGSCFLLATDGTSVKAAKRTAWLEPGDGYHDVDTIVESCTPAVKKLHAELAAGKDHAVTYVFGELFGSSVQDEIPYGTELSFVCFDVAVSGKFVDYSKVLLACSNAGMPCLQPLFKVDHKKRGSSCFVFPFLLTP